ncbi:MAG: hypothetical protein QG628_426, partial [Patescibacteria group bacterium]|nr:hypothetical protein [Patescibacteria group bacterium]
INLTAKAIQNPDYGYFPTSPDLQSYSINRIRLDDNAINPGGGGWPINSAGVLGFVPSQVSNYFYTINPFVADQPSGKFDPSVAVDAVETTNYPSNARVNKGDFSQDNTKYYSTNSQLTTLSVVDTATNDWLKDIELGERPITAWTGTNGKIYAVVDNNQIKIIDTSTDTVSKTLAVPCVNAESTATVVFSQDVNYPYYFVPCNNDGTFIKYKVSDDSLAGTLNVGLSPSTGALSLDNKRLYFSSLFGTADSNKFRVVNVSDGSEIITKTMTTGVLGILPTSDFQKIYASTPGNDFNTQNIDIMDTTTYDVTSVATNGVPGAVSTLPTETSEAAVQVAFILGATTPISTTSGTLAETGVLLISSVLLTIIILATTIYLYVDYRKHKKPLVEINPNVHYTFAHHVRMVNIPLLKYRLTFSVEKKHGTFNRF